MKRVLLVIHVNTYFHGLLPAGRLLRESKQYAPLFFFCRYYPTIQDDLQICQTQGLPCLLSQDVNAIQPSPAKGVSETLKAYARRRLPLPLRAATKRFLRSVSSVTSDNPFRNAIWLARQIRVVRQVIRSQGIALLVLPADNRYDQAVYVKAAHLEHKPVVVVPQFMASPLEWAEFVWNKSEYQLERWANRLFGKLYPRWICEHKGRKLLALPASQALVREWLAIAPPLPWVLHSGFADALALESEAVRDYCIEEGLPSPALYVAGSGAHDILADGLRHASQKRIELCNSLGLVPDHPILLSALPPDLFSIGRPTQDFNTYTELVEFWCRSLAALDGWNPIVCLHPSVRAASMKYIEEWGVRIADEPAAQLIPLCDIFVASISATIQWAIACGKPVVNYDAYHYRYTDYAGVGGVILVEGKNDFQQVLGRLESDAGFRATISARQFACAERWGRLDGKAGERLLELFDVMIDRYSGVNTLG